MPIYELRCVNCGKVDEYLVFGRSEEEECKHCGSKGCEKLMSVFGFKSSSNKGISGGGGCAGCPSSNCSSCS